MGCVSEIDIADLAYDVSGKSENNDVLKKPETQCPRVMGKIDNIEIECLIDTGSNATCMSERLYRNLNEKLKLATLPVTNLSISGAVGGKVIRIKKQVSTELVLGNLAIESIFLVVPNLCYNIIIGSDWLILNHAIIDYSKKQFFVKDEIICEPCVSFSMRLPTSYENIKVMLLTSIKVGQESYPATEEGSDSSRMQNCLEAGDNARFSSCSPFDFEKQLRVNLDKVKTINDKQKSQLIDLALEFKDIFSNRPGRLHGYECRFKLTKPNPMIRKSYPIPLAYRSAVDAEINRLLENGIIEHASSPYCNPVRVVRKHDGSVRLCLDARELNKYLENDNEAPQLIEDLLQAHSGVEFYTASDFTEGYHQLALHPDSRKYTAFSINGHVLQYCVVPFGVKISGSEFIRALTLLFGNDLRFKDFLLLYVDDAVIKSKSFDEHLSHLRLFWEKIRVSGLTLKITKTLFCRKEIPFLGFILSTNGIRPDPDRVQAIRELPPPRSLKELQRFIGICTYYRRFYDKFSSMLNPFRQLLSKNNRFVWQEVHNTAFERIKNAFAQEVLLSHYRMDKPFWLQTDASRQGVSAVLFQKDDDGKEMIIALVSRCLTSYEQNYSSTEIELLAIIFAVMKLRHFLLGRTFNIITDHQALVFLLKTQYYTSRLLRWFLVLQNYSYNIIHCSGRDNLLADYFSRVSTNNVDGQDSSKLINNNVIREPPVVLVAAIRAIDTWIPELKNIALLQQADVSIQNTERVIRDGKLDIFRIHEGVVFYKGQNEVKWRIVVPAALQLKLINVVHEKYGHPGIFKTLCALNEHFWWKAMRKHVKMYVRCCDVCQRVKPANKNTAGPFLPVSANRPNELIAIDFYGPLPRTIRGSEYILVVLDVFSRLVRLYPLKRATTAASIRCLQQYFAEYGTPARVLSDHGTQFVSEKWGRFLRECGSKAVYSSVRHPQSNPGERIMRQLGCFFRTYCFDKHTAWGRYIADIEQWINLSTHCITGYTPYQLHYGESPQSKIKALIPFPPESVEPHEIIIELARERSKEANEKRKLRQKVCPSRPFKIGDRVLLKVPKQSSALNKKIAKFFHVFYGPYQVARVFNDNAYELVSVDHPEEVIGHYNRVDLKEYHSSPSCDNNISLTAW